MSFSSRAAGIPLQSLRTFVYACNPCVYPLFFTILNQKEFRIATVAMFTCDLYAGVVPQMSPPPHDLERLRMTMVDFIVIFNTPEHGST